MTLLLTLDQDEITSLLNHNKYVFKKICKNVSKVFLYVKYPIDKVIGECKIVDIIRNTPNNIWDTTHSLSTIKKQKYDDYYKSSQIAIAYEIGNIKLYKSPKSITNINYDLMI